MPTPEQVAALIELVDLSLKARHGVVDDAGFATIRERLARRALSPLPEPAEAAR